MRATKNAGQALPGLRVRASSDAASHLFLDLAAVLPEILVHRRLARRLARERLDELVALPVRGLQLGLATGAPTAARSQDE